MLLTILSITTLIAAMGVVLNERRLVKGTDVEFTVPFPAFVLVLAGVALGVIAAVSKTALKPIGAQSEFSSKFGSAL